MKRSLFAAFFLLLSGVSFAQSGLTWSNVGIGGTVPVGSVSFASKDTAFATHDVSQSRIMRSIDGGYTWSSFTTPSLGYVKFFDPLNGYVFADNGTISWSNATSDGGLNWGPNVNDSFGGFNAPAFLMNSDTAFAADNALIMRTTDHGGTWQRMTAPVITALYAIAFADAQHGMVVGQHLDPPATGCLCMISSDGGKNWVQKSNPSFQDLIGVTYCGVDTAIAISDVIERSTDGGNSWTDVTPALGFAGNWSAISSSHTNVVVVGASGAIIFSSDAGLTWTHEASGTQQELYSVAMYNDTVALATGQAGTILRATAAFSSVSASPAETVSYTYPNPAQTTITIPSNLSASDRPVCNLYSEAGILLTTIPLTPSSSSATGTDYTLDVHSLTDGTYFYSIAGTHFGKKGAFVISRK